jgi:subtilase family serine protease
MLFEAIRTALRLVARTGHPLHDASIDCEPSHAQRPLARFRVKLLATFLMAAWGAASAFALSPAASEQGSAGGQAPSVIKQGLDLSRIQPLAGHLPGWANAENLTGSVPPELPMNRLTLVLARSVEQEQAFETFLGEQQNPASPEYHHWLTPEEIGDRFGLSQEDIDSIAGWLQSQGLHVTFVAPSRIFIGFSGAAGDVARAFQTDFKYYNVHGEQLFAVASEPMIPEALAPAIQAIRGLQSSMERPQHIARAERKPSPDAYGGGTTYWVAPADFAKIYNLPSNLTGVGQTIGIVGESRIYSADITNFNSFLGTSVPIPTVVIPPGGVDPGPAAGPCTNNCNPPGAQTEATLDVQRAGSTAHGAKLLLVVASEASGGIDAATQYLVHTSPVPARVISISWGGCEAANPSSADTYWNTLFQVAAGEGITVLVSSGDSGASGCDTHGQAPPADPYPNSPNDICSSGYVTCVGGTEFADTNNPAEYWNSSNGAGYESALGYIPEGAWNEPWNYNYTTPQIQVAASGGGVSAYIPTPSWQTGTGVPAARAGRYTPDVSFTAANHDGYIGCLAAGGGPCNNGYIEVFSGTSASAPGMAGVAALLNQSLGGAQGNLNSTLYKMAKGAPTAFHDVTVATSGVSPCSVGKPSMCNNSAASPTALTGGQPGFLVGPGYDEVTGLGSLNVSVFLGKFSAYSITAPAVPTLKSPANAASLAAGTTSETLSWSAPTGATKYNVQAYTVSCGGTLFKQVTGNATTSVSLTGLTNGKTYYWRVQAGNTAGNSSYSSCFNFGVKAIPAVPTLTTPANAASLAQGTTSTTLKWSAAGGATSYTVQAYTVSCGGTAVTVGAPGAGLSLALSGLVNGKTYYWRVRANDANGSSAYSSCFDFSVK